MGIVSYTAVPLSLPNPSRPPFFVYLCAFTAGWAGVPGPVFLGLAGQLTQSLPPGALFSQVIGQAVSPTRVLIDVQPFIHLA